MRGISSDATAASWCSRASTSSSSSSIPRANEGPRPKPCSIRAQVRLGAMSARDTLIAELRAHALIVGDVVLTSGRTAQYYVDAKRAVLRPAGFAAMGELIAELAREWDARAVGGLTMG